MEANHSESLDVDEQAAYWLGVMEDPSPDDQAAFLAWISASPVHVSEFLLAGKLDHALESFDRGRRIDVDALILQASRDVAAQNLGAHSHQGRRQSRWLAGVAASVAVCALVAALTLVVSTARSTYTTKLGEQRLLDLDDGSTILLNTQSKVKVNYNAEARDVYLDNGQALFRVRHDATRPFRVHAGAVVVQAIGTQFDVRVFPDRTTVAVVEGTVQVSGPAAPGGTGLAPGTTQQSPPRVTAGEGATIDVGGKIEPVAPVDTAAITAWSQQKLVFKGEPLAQIADEFNRYNVTPKLRVEGDALRGRRFILVFNAHNPGSLLEYLAQDGTVTFVHDGDNIVIRPRDNGDADPAAPHQ